ncbi:phosphoglycerate kinase [Candidatus Roizmanbacteria bacterium RIFCSPLOWO2_12_FULL_40_12]|uniref:Phosphoglycerate kinase n=1 Tax=Candidatus Roizmanbacteria bacterium RIFCSPLOWO2_01_FULL_40_42 TaxID=1802066 RepID=A0A1F7J5R9_9BACT|nr:MAG: phosphoglycerate kinase [Candidatus Roizmanbacteria bacterium RIFCSPHIGHO2_01_FULL_40_98]OGK28387.1 MAG: phosphoglycerate kinase [Candidatus Roizmanbacteria bacterium RIFCSPHIGHO2_02_FULL_40_53]OGK30623.1 MAG: phosphoglycerate kinase [Candidatus Roizmanbacteria bacterium RIFCSPHIGHO2_12_41_18]OGK37037.1 MAG: phosphoglycerate kinase [Candidatus Roizmanbacteria bacterium RIFCSPHIGHO2_12_FULL_40_130]OGK50943.1 MAG: phosphoglycerate kinase [Candidatus Roizmanbacteria bacterium RIFCSPLOWO2_0
MSTRIKFIDEVSLEKKTILLRVDLNVALDGEKNLRITDDVRIRQVIPTIKFLQKKGNKLILVSHLSNPQKRDSRYSLRIILKRLKKLLPEYRFRLIEDFLSAKGKKLIASQKENEILLLENIRFHEGERENDQDFAKKLSKIADIYVNDAFAVSHRSEASIVKVPKLIPSFGGLLLKNETKTISEIFKKNKKPFIAIVGGAKIETKVDLISKLIGIADYILVGGGVANTFLCAYGYEIGKSFCEHGKVRKAQELMELARKKKTVFIIPSDVAVGNSKNQKKGIVEKVGAISRGMQILDIGPKTQNEYCSIIAKARTVVWNGPVGYFENRAFSHGTNSIYHAIAKNMKATSIIGGGETLSSISNEAHHDQIAHLSTGGGAMLEYIQNGMLPGILALAQ